MDQTMDKKDDYRIPIRLDLSGKKYGRLLVIERSDDYVSPKGKHVPMWKCLCDCGNVKDVSRDNLRNGNVISCRCYDAERKRMIRNGRTKNMRLAAVYNTMKQRCINKKSNAYKSYGARGIVVCDEWSGKDGFINFCKWAKESGYNEKAKYGDCTIDRIDVNGPYSPENCKWANLTEQARNRRSNRLIKFRGEEKTLQEWSEITNIQPSTIMKRLRIGWSVDRALTERVRKAVKPWTNHT